MNIVEYKERPNTHLLHFELLVTLGKEGLEEINDKIDKFIKRLSGEETTLVTTTKIDGSPAVVLWHKFEGYPDDSICLKSFVNNANNCISSNDDVDNKYSDRPEMAEKLKYCLRLAKCIPDGEAWLGDCLFTLRDLREININCLDYLTFQPNKIIYAFGKENANYELVKNSSFGICFHTIYRGNLEHKTLSFNVDRDRLNSVPSDIYVMSPVLNAPNQGAAYNLDLIKLKYLALKNVENKLNNDRAYLELCDNQMFLLYWSLFENANLSDKQATNIDQDKFYDELTKFVHDKVDSELNKKISTLKTEKGRLGALQKYGDLLAQLDDILKNDKITLTLIVAAINLVSDIKMLMLSGFLQSDQGYSTFYNTRSQGYIPADMEGVAMSSEGDIVKIVDRSKFSHANRSDDYIGGWQHESLDEDTKKKRNGEWVNKGSEGEHGEFRTKKAADALRKAMFANGYREDVNKDNMVNFVSELNSIITRKNKYFSYKIDETNSDLHKLSIDIEGSRDDELNDLLNSISKEESNLDLIKQQQKDFINNPLNDTDVKICLSELDNEISSTTSTIHDLKGKLEYPDFNFIEKTKYRNLIKAALKQYDTLSDLRARCNNILRNLSKDYSLDENDSLEDKDGECLNDYNNKNIKYPSDEDKQAFYEEYGYED